MLSFLILLVGVAAAIVVSFIISAIFEAIAETIGSTCPVGGSGALLWCFIAVPFELIGLVVGMFSSATGWALFLYPMWAMLIAYAVFSLLSLFASVFMKD